MRMLLSSGLMRASFLCVLFFSSCTMHQGSSSEDDVVEELVCTCLSPYNDPEMMTEWVKVEAALRSRGIWLSVFSSVGASFYARRDKADEARAIILHMIKDGEVDAAKLKLEVKEQ